MKIIGVSGDSFICEVTQDETARILGYRDYYYLKDKRRPLVSGDRLNVSKAWAFMEKARKAAAELKGAARTLEAVGLALVGIPDQIDRILEEKDAEPSKENATVRSAEDPAS